MTIDVDAIEDDDDVVESTASAFDRVSSLLLLLLLYPTITIHVCVSFVMFFHPCTSLQYSVFAATERTEVVPRRQHETRSSWVLFRRGEEKNISQLKVLSQVQNLLLLLLQKQQNKSLIQSISRSEPNYQKKNKLKALKLLCSRELSGSVIALNNKKNKSNFKEEIEKTHASNPLVWRYDSTKNIGDAALKEFQVDIQTFQGLTTKNILVAGSN
ncbi:hypothetical protein HID58_085747 [Brassica napus]|uniref:Uncharacterized protein n=1 Tax=Brassica napus TaxID=3708 RepID=A0ABQ7XQZ2_BRANA|nr:hypothetical protein HID58_085747 [Brassica napus]